jgi:hypothetical protein
LLVWRVFKFILFPVEAVLLLGPSIPSWAKLVGEVGDVGDVGDLGDVGDAGGV